MSDIKSVNNACLKFSYINGVGGAKCTQVLKKRVRQEFEKNNKISTYVWGMDCSQREKIRAERLLETMPEYNHEFPLIERSLTKQDTHGILKKVGIARPKMYDLGYNNNNCIGCVKGNKGYWNKIRIDFPEVFEQRSKLERKIGASCINGYYLDELPVNLGRKQKPITEECDVMCEISLEAGDK